MKQTFLIGAATAAHQVEGNNANSDCWAQEHLPHTVYLEPSNIACDHYHRYEEDISLLAKAGLNAYRFGVEWARIEPKQGQWDEKEIEHYRRVILFCRQMNVEPIVTLHHFSSPRWLISLGGWESEDVIPLFARYCKKVIEELGQNLHYVCTINEANMGMQLADLMQEIMAKMAANVQVGINTSSDDNQRELYAKECGEAFGIDPRHINTFLTPRTEKGDEIICQAHIAARKAIREIAPNIKVGLTLSLHDIQALPGGEELAKKKWHMEFGHYLDTIKEDGFLGVQNYTRKVVDSSGEKLPTLPLTGAGYERYPEGLGNVISKVAKDFKGEILITENGIDAEDDNLRIDFIEKALKGVLKAKSQGANVIGYIHWSLLDNYEWQKGFTPKFGLVALDRKTMQRKPKESLSHLGKWALSIADISQHKINFDK